MTIYSFNVDVDQNGLDRFDTVEPDLRSDSEQRHTMLALHNNEAPELAYARMLADEVINVSGAEVDVYIRTDNNDFDHVWDSDPDPTYWNRVSIKAFFKPEPVETELKKWGNDTINRTEAVFSHRQLFVEFGARMLRVGDVLVLPWGGVNNLTPKTYRITNATPTGNFRYNWLYFTCKLESLTADITVRPPHEVSLPVDDDDRTNGQYIESI